MKRFIFVMALCMSMLLVKNFASAKEFIDYSNIAAPVSICVMLGEYDEGKCMSNPKLRALGCESISPADQYLGALKPAQGMAVCHYSIKNQGVSSVKDTGCSHRIANQYIVGVGEQKNVKLNVIKTKDEYRRYFAPIEDEKEAISYLVGLVDATPIFRFTKSYHVGPGAEKGKFTVSDPQPTTVEKKEDGYVVNLFKSGRCGCQRPELTEITYFVSTNGEIKEKGKKTIWQADKSVNLCVD